MGGVAIRAREVTAQVTDPAAWNKFQEDLKQWEETCSAMDQWEAEVSQKSVPGPCCLSVYWWQMLCTLCEVPCRLSYHLVMWGLGSLLSLCFGRRNELLELHETAHAAMFLVYVHIIPQMMVHNLANPCSPFYVYEEDVSLQRPGKPQFIGPDSKPDERGKKSKPNGWCTCCDCKCLDFLDHSNRLIRAAFCWLGCHHSCHPALVCGPLCTDPSCCTCCESWTQRFERWDRDGAEAKQKRTREFYQKTGRVYTPDAGLTGVAPAAGHNLGTKAANLGKPGQQEMV